LRLISWNTAGRVSRATEQVAALGARLPDVVALQEIRSAAEPVLRSELGRLGLLQAVGSRELCPPDFSWSGPRQYGLLLASRWPLTAMPPETFQVPWPERVLSAVLSTPAGPIELHTTGIPPGSTNGWTKVEMYEGLYSGLGRPSEMPRILCGDLNTPQEEREDGEVVTWGQSINAARKAALWRTFKDKSGRSDTGARWDRAERNVLVGLREFDLHDVFRAVNGNGRQASSWYWRSGTRQVGRRFDHVFASKILRPHRCDYLDALRLQGLSDHAPIEADFEP
jgi:exonuclease III